LVQHYTDQAPGVRKNARVTDWSGSSNSVCHVNHPVVLHDSEESPQRLEQTEEHVMMVGSLACKVSPEIHING
jgi:hypothetical protein